MRAGDAFPLRHDAAAFHVPDAVDDAGREYVWAAAGTRSERGGLVGSVRVPRRLRTREGRAAGTAYSDAAVFPAADEWVVLRAVRAGRPPPVRLCAYRIFDARRATAAVEFYPAATAQLSALRLYEGTSPDST